MKQELLELGSYVTAHAERNEADQVEVYIESIRRLEIKIEKGFIRLASEKHDYGCGIRVAIGNRLGLSYVTSLIESDLEMATQDAIRAAKASVPDPHFKYFASVESSYPNVKGLFDKNLGQIDCEQAIDIMNRAIQSSKEISGKERNLVEGGFISESKTRAITNSNGVSCMSSETMADLEIYSTIGIGDEKCSSDNNQSTREIGSIDPEKVGATSAQNALNLRGAQTVDGGDMPLVLAPRALATVLGRGLVDALDAKNIQDGNSYLIDSLGSKVASSKLAITDTGVLPAELGSRPFDAEGYPSQSTPLISSGILQNYLHNSYSSARDDVANTGNAARSSYRLTPRIAASNLLVVSGTSSLDEMISEVNKGVLCTYTHDRPNSVTGELSAMIMEGFLISRGEIKHALKGTLFGTTLQDLMSRTILIGNDVERRSPMISPSILVESVKITSG